MDQLGVGNHAMLNTFQLILLEHIAMCRLVMGNRTLAIKEVSALLLMNLIQFFRKFKIIVNYFFSYSSLHIIDCSSA